LAVVVTTDDDRLMMIQLRRMRGAFELGRSIDMPSPDLVQVSCVFFVGLYCFWAVTMVG